MTRLPAAALILLAAASPLLAGSNKVLNPAFTTDLGSWTEVPHAGVSDNWTGGVGDTAAGAYAVTTSAIVNTIVLRQCTNVLPGIGYAFGISYRISGVFPEPRPSGGLQVQWRGGAGCTGTVLGEVVTPAPSTQVDFWQGLKIYASTSPAGAHSASLSLTVATTDASATTSYFDDVYFESGTAIGDADGNGAVDIGDVFYLINGLFAGGPLPIGPVDVNDDLLVNVSDVFYLINYLFAGGPAPK